MEKGQWENNEVVLRGLKKNCFVYLIQELDSCENIEGSIKFDIKLNEGDISLEQNLIFSECFSVSYHVHGEYISIQLLNENKYTVQLYEIQQEAENIKLCSEQLPIYLDPGQQFHCFTTESRSSFHLILKYTADPDPLNKLFQDHFILTRQQHFEQSLHIKL